MDKSELREQALWHLEHLPPGVEDPEQAAMLFLEHVPIAKDARVAVYWPMAKEFDSRPIIASLIERGIPVALPVPSTEAREMRFAAWDGFTNLIKGAFGVYIPPVVEAVEPDIVLVPMLAFDRKGNRLGRGAGHYDATIAAPRARRHILAVGAAYAAQAVLFGLPAEPHDQKLDMVVTPEAVHDFRP